MSERAVIIPTGYVWMRIVFEDFSQAIIDRERNSGKLLIGNSAASNPWYLLYLDDAAMVLRKALISRELVAFYCADDRILEVPFGFWRKKEANLVVRLGDYYTDHAETEDIFLDQKQFENFKATYFDINSHSRAEVSRSNRGPQPTKREAIKCAMRRMSRMELGGMKEEAMAATFGASRDTCRKAREEVLSEIVGD